MPEQHKQKQQDAETELENKPRRGGKDAREDRHQGNRGGQQQSKDKNAKRDRSEGEEKRGFESAGRGVRAKGGLVDEPAEKELGDKSDESETGMSSRAEDEDVDDPTSNVKGGQGRAKKTNRDLDENDTN